MVQVYQHMPEKFESILKEVLKRNVSLDVYDNKGAFNEILSVLTQKYHICKMPGSFSASSVLSGSIDFIF